MLKITYTETGFYLEYLTESLETWVGKRTLVSLRAATSIYVQPYTASLMLNINLPYVKDLKTLTEDNEIVELSVCDNEYLEISLQGTWVSSQENSEEGVFVCELNQNSEFFLNKLWQESQLGTSVMSE